MFGRGMKHGLNISNPYSMKHFQKTLLFFTTLILSLNCCSRAGAQTNFIPDRPEKLSFPPLNYEPPNAADHRVQLKSGPVAYVVPDRTLPLVNIAVYVRTGQYLEPTGKEGVAALTG